MTASTAFEQHLATIEAGERLEPQAIRDLAGRPDILALGMLADMLRRRIHNRRATYLRVALCPFDRPFADAAPAAARELRITGHPPSLDSAVAAVAAARAAAGDRVVSGLSWRDVTAFAADAGDVPRVLRALRDAGLDALAGLPLEAMAEPDQVVGPLVEAGFEQLRVTVDTMSAADRVEALLRLSDTQRRHGCVVAVNPLPMSLNAFRPTTGYDDVKMVAVARLAVPDVAHVQVDWLRYGPKLAQVALTFGADDIDGVSPADDAPDGRRRAALEEIRRNIQAAGFEPVERDGSFRLI